MIVVTVFLSILNQIKFHLVQNRKESYPIQCERKWKYSFLSAGIKIRLQKEPRSETAVRQTSVSRHHGGPNEGSLEASPTSQHYRIEGFKGVLNWAPIMPREASVLDIGCEFFQSDDLGMPRHHNDELRLVTAATVNSHLPARYFAKDCGV